MKTIEQVKEQVVTLMTREFGSVENAINADRPKLYGKLLTWFYVGADIVPLQAADSQAWASVDDVVASVHKYLNQ